MAGVLGIGALTAFTSTYHPFGIASYTTVSERTVSVGAPRYSSFLGSSTNTMPSAPTETVRSLTVV